MVLQVIATVPQTGAVSHLSNRNRSYLLSVIPLWIQ
jgi:hypothetical protein